MQAIEAVSLLIDDLIEVEESKFPTNFLDDRVMDFARERGEEFEYFQQARSILTDELWPECDRAFMCLRQEISAIPTMKFIDNGQLGESDIRDAVKAIRQQVSHGCLPTDESYLEPVSENEDDDEAMLNAIKEMQIVRQQEGGIRRAFDPFVDQLLVRGASALGLQWERRTKVMQLPKELVNTLGELGELQGITDEDGEIVTAKSFKKTKYYKTVYNGPRIYPVDMYRLLIDPASSVHFQNQATTIYIQMKTLNDLKSAIDTETKKPLYDHKVLEQIQEWTWTDYYKAHPHSGDTTKALGIMPDVRESSKFIPIYIFHSPTLTTDDGDTYVDKFFHLTRSPGSSKWYVIRVHDNPSDYGDQPFYYTTCDQWLGEPYGTGLVEKSLPSWKAKNIMHQLHLNGSVLTVFPPMMYIDGMVKNGGKPVMQPAGMTAVVPRPQMGTTWMQPFPINPNSAMYGMQEQRFLSEKIVAQTGASMAQIYSNPTKSSSKGKTATEVRQTSTDGAVSQQTLIDKINDDVMQPLSQSVYNLSRQHDTEGYKFMSMQNGQPELKQIGHMEIDRDRRIKIVGRRALFNKAHELDNIMNCLKLLANPQAAQIFPTLPIMLQDMFIKALSKLGMPMKEEYRTDPAMLAAQSPQAQMAALQGALQNPQMLDQLIQMLLDSPMGQQFVQEVEQAAMERGMQAGHAQGTQEANHKNAMQSQLKDQQHQGAMAAQAQQHQSAMQTQGQEHAFQQQMAQLKQPQAK